MPVSFSPSLIPANSFFSSPNLLSPLEIFKNACHDPYRQSDEIFQSSFFQDTSDVLPTYNGFVMTLSEAYNQHRALIIRPDDVWTAILVQFNLFVNGHAETLRSQFVSHKGKKLLTVYASGTRYTVNFGQMAHAMTREIHQNVLDPSLRSWILPNFTTTTDNDIIVSSVVMMATMKKYFNYEFALMCGLPRVTLEGEKRDWEDILGRLEKLKEYGLETTAWYHLLKPVISRFVKAFDMPYGPEYLDFWNRITHYSGGGSGPTYLGGWITAFTVFDEDGEWMGHPFTNGTYYSSEMASLSTEDFFAKHTFRHETFVEFGKVPQYVVLDGAPYHHVETSNIPNGYAEVDVRIDDNGAIFPSKMVAGQVATQISSSGDKKLSPTGERDTVRPVSGWWIFSLLPAGQLREAIW
ncbi:hypothetical protein BGX27_008887 [Mortierella sp. AM989]|nr:hypothetical protein BGX27_008887 [Mortierella sp. AM989]